MAAVCFILINTFNSCSSHCLNKYTPFSGCNASDSTEEEAYAIRAKITVYTGNNCHVLELITQKHKKVVPLTGLASKYKSREDHSPHRKKSTSLEMIT